MILKTVSIRRRDYFLSIFFGKKIVTTSGILRAFILLSACNMDKFKDFEIKSRESFKKSGGFYGLQTENELVFTQSIQSVTVSFHLPVNPCFVNFGIKKCFQKFTANSLLIYQLNISLSYG